MMMPFCPNCGKEVSESGAFCPSCGYNVKQPQRESSEVGGLPEQKDLNFSKRKSRVGPIAAIIVVIIVIAIAGIYVIHYLPQNNTSTNSPKPQYSVQSVTILPNGDTFTLPPGGYSDTQFAVPSNALSYPLLWVNGSFSYNALIGLFNSTEYIAFLQNHSAPWGVTKTSYTESGVNANGHFTADVLAPGTTYYLVFYNPTSTLGYNPISMNVTITQSFVLQYTVSS